MFSEFSSTCKRIAKVWKLNKFSTLINFSTILTKGENCENLSGNRKTLDCFRQHLKIEQQQVPARTPLLMSTESNYFAYLYLMKRK